MGPIWYEFLLYTEEMYLQTLLERFSISLSTELHCYSFEETPCHKLKPGHIRLLKGIILHRDSISEMKIQVYSLYKHLV